MHFVQIVSEADLREFWDLFAKQDSKRFGGLLANLLKRIPKTPYDNRTKQIFTDVLSWGAAHPEEILDPFGNRDSPNFVAFCALFGQLHTLHNETGDSIGSFVHDEQNQFVPTFISGWNLLSKFEGKNGPMSLLADWEKIESFACELVEKSSTHSFGLQIIDVSMWLLKRVLDNEDDLSGNCRTLYDCLVERSTISRFDFNTLVSTVEIGSQYVERLPLTEEQLSRAKEFGAEMEDQRQNRMLQGPPHPPRPKPA